MTNRIEPIVTHERSALAALHLRGARPRRRATPCPSAEDLDVAVGHLRVVAATTGETPAALCARLHIMGERRRKLVRPGGGWRLRKKEVAALRVERAGFMLYTRSDAKADAVRAAEKGIAVGSPEWQKLMDEDRAWREKQKKKRIEAGPKPGGGQWKQPRARRA